MNVAELLNKLGESPSASARATGLSRATIQRLRDGVSEPTTQTLRELALSMSLDLEISLVPASDPLAAIAARALLDPTMPAASDAAGWLDLGIEDFGVVSTWAERLKRQAGTEPSELVRRAGVLSSPQHRKGARFFAPRQDFSLDRTVAIAHGAIGKPEGALSGIAAVKTYLGDVEVLGPVLIWTTEVASVAERLAASFEEVDSYQSAGVLIAPTPAAYFVDMLVPPAFEHKIVSPIQLAIDLFGLGYQELASEITGGW